jgi:hypothetical protein
MKTLTISEIKKANNEIGQKWFAKGAMLFFNTIIETQPNKADLFITSEKIEDWHKRKYTIRWYNRETHEVVTISAFMAYDTIDQARLVRKKLTKLGVKRAIDTKNEFVLMPV